MVDRRPAAAQLRSLAAMADASACVAAQRQVTHTIQAPPNRTGLPDGVKAGVERLSGQSLDAVRVHYNSPAPAQLQAHAYAEGNAIHVAPGQERHVAHEAWHVAQQMQGRVKPTMQMAGTPVNDDPGLEREADEMGARAADIGAAVFPAGEGADDASRKAPAASAAQRRPVVQRLAGMEVELRIPFYGDTHGVGTGDGVFTGPNRATVGVADRRAIVDFLYGGLEYGDSYGEVPGHYDISADHTAWRRHHARLREHIHANHMADPGQDTEMSNLEYRTTALEERRDTDEATMRLIAAEVRAHAEDSAQKATQGAQVNLSAPVPGLYSGIPVQELTRLLQNDVAGLALLTTMVNALDPSLYYQTTVGTLPSEVPRLFRQAAADLHAVDPASAKAAVLLNAVRCAKLTMEDGANAALVATLSEPDKHALKGWLTLVAQTMLAHQLETTSLRYRPDGAGHLHPGGGTEKNLLPYLSKTLFSNTILALPPAARPNGTAPWKTLVRELRDYCDPVNTDLVGDLGLTEYNTQPYHDPETNVQIGIVAHTGLIGNQSPLAWIYALLDGRAAGNAHVRSGHELGLDAGQEALHPALSIRGEQAIPLEDRASQSKESFGDPRAIDQAENVLNAAWDMAKARRIGSTAIRTTYNTQHAALAARLQAYGTLPTLVPALNALVLRMAPLADPDDLQIATNSLQTLTQDVTNWQGANTNPATALALLTPLINKANWSTKGNAFIGKKVPDGVQLMRTELAAGNNAATTLANLGAIATTRLGSGARDPATTHMYQLARDTPGWIAGGAAGWSNFVAKYNTTNGAV